ncbi:MAG: pyrimidine 5'-nucleotidase [Terricaulis sp.]
MSGAFAHVSDWVFDLDNTLYPAPMLYDAIGERMTAYIARAVGIDATTALELREHYFHLYGATVVGLATHHRIDARDFMADVHDVDYSVLAPDPELAALIAALPGRKFIYTNGGGGHAQRALAALGLEAVFDTIFDLENADFSPKPHPLSYRRLIEACAINPSRALFVEDTMRNLEPAHELGFTTALVGAVHPEPKPAYVRHWAADVKALLRAA